MSHIRPLGLALLIFKFPELLKVPHVEEALDEHQQQDADQSHGSDGRPDDDCNIRRLWTVWRKSFRSEI